MNWQQGLRRLSAVFWGFWALVAVVFVIAICSDYVRSEGFAYALGYGTAVGGFLVGIIVLAHRLTCWVIGGFFRTTP